MDVCDFTAFAFIKPIQPYFLLSEDGVGLSDFFPWLSAPPGLARQAMTVFFCEKPYILVQQLTVIDNITKACFDSVQW